MAAHAEGRSFSFAILFHGDLIGVVGINAANREEMSESCDYAIASSHWNKGIATRAVALALRFAFVELGLKAIRSACLQRNPASGRVLRKNRFREIGEFLYSSSKFQNEPALNFELLRHVWISPSSSSTSAAPRSPDWSP
jgi:RimJ/RimL family protein N-acetyltransferase